MSAVYPEAWLLLLGLGLLWWLHLRAQPEGTRFYTAFFLLEEAAGAGERGRKIRQRWLWLARSLAWLALLLVIVQLRPVQTGGTVLISDGPVGQIDAGWPQPVRLLRAGQPPEWHEGAPAQLPRVLGSPDWPGAWLMARQAQPDARIEWVRHTPGARITGAGAAQSGARTMIVAATADSEAAPTLHLPDGRAWPLQPQGGFYALTEALPEGIAHLSLVGAEDWPLCLPDLRPLSYATEGWPEAVLALFALREDLIEAAPGVQAQLQVGVAPAARDAWAPFAPARTLFSFGQGDGDERPTAPLSFAHELPAPGASVHRWRPLQARGEVWLHAEDEPVVTQAAGREGAVVRFGFEPEQSDLPESAAWPVLFEEILQRARGLHSRCRVHRAEARLVIDTAPGQAVRLTSPQGQTRALRAPSSGRLALDGLDSQGHYRLESEGQTAWIAVVPSVGQAGSIEVPERIEASLPPSPQGSPTLRRVFAGLAALLLCGAWALSRRWRSPWALLAVLCAAAIPLDLHLGEGAVGPVVVAVDVSDSMPAQALEQALQQVESQLRAVQAPLLRVEGAAEVHRVVEAPEPLVLGGGRTRLAGVIGAADRLAGPHGAVVLLSDGQAPDLPTPTRSALSVVPVNDPEPDARVLQLQAFSLGGQIFARAQVVADRPVAGTLRLGPASLPVRLDTEAQWFRAGFSRAELDQEVGGQRDRVRARISVKDDRAPGNDERWAPIEDTERASAVAVGPHTAAWAEAAGLEPVSVDAAGLWEQGARFARARALLLNDVPLDALRPALIEALRHYVEGGGFLLLAGRTQAFGPGGWANSPLEALSPLRSDPRPPGEGRVALALVVDSSGSMADEAGGIGPQGWSSLVSGLASDLRDEDYLGIVTFAGEAQVLLAPTLRAQLDPAQIPVPEAARGGTNILPALRETAALLGRTPAEVRVALVVTDGQFSDGQEGPELAALTERLHSLGVRMEALVVGPDPRRFPLNRVVEGTGGELRYAPDEPLAKLGRIGLLGAASGGLLAEKSTVLADQAWAARVGGALPAVEARVRVRAQPQARVLARAQGEPLLAEWTLGEGRVVALATDAWALSAPQWAALLAPASAPRPALSSLSAEEAGLFWRGAPEEPPPLGPLVLVDGADRRYELPIFVEGPGEAFAPWPEGLSAQPGLLDLSLRTSLGPLAVRRTRPLPQELRETGLNVAALKAQVAVSGGALLAAEDARRALSYRRAAPGRDLGPFLALAALLLLLIETARWATAGRRRSAE